MFADRGLLNVLVLAAIMGLLQLLGPEHLRYQPQLLHIGEWWRFLTGHWVHANWTHYALNMAGLGLCLALTEVRWTLWDWSWRILLLSVGISILFWQFNPDIGWYVGFSGVLFGLYVLAAVDSLARQKLIAVALLIIIGLKIVFDLIPSAKIDSSDLIGVPVLTEAHLYGVLVALCVVLLMQVQVYFRFRQKQDIHE